MEQDLPKVLVVSINAWRDNTGINTLINFFQHWNPDRVAQIYTRSVLPDTKVCSHFFQISENSVIKSVLRRNMKTGKEVHNEHKSKEKLNHIDKNAMAEQRKYSFFRKHRSYLFELAREAAWGLGKWKSGELNDFISSFDADILFIPIYAYTYMNRLQLYVIQRAERPVITYIADDVYSYKSEKGNLLFYINRYFLRKSIDKVMKYNDKLLVIAPKLQQEFDRIFSTKSELLTKGSDFSVHTFERHICNKPLRIVYTGKTNIGRWQSLSLLAQAIKRINRNGIKLFLEIYTKEELTRKVLKALDVEGASKVMGGVPLDKALQIQKEADMVVFAESLSWKYRDAARLSFSTKLTDYFANGKCILAIGSKEIAPIEYLIQQDAALVATNKDELMEKLGHAADDPKLIEEYAWKAYVCGRENHNEPLIRERFKSAVLSACEKK